MPTIYEHAKNIPRIKKGRELLCWILYQIMKYFVPRLMFVSATSPVVLYTYNFVLSPFYLSYWFLGGRVSRLL